MSKKRVIDNRPFTLHIYYDRHNQPHVSTDLTDNYKSTGSKIDPVIAKMLTDVRNYALEAHMLRTSTRAKTKTPLLPPRDAFQVMVEHSVK